MRKEILVLVPYFPPWQYYTNFFYRLYQENDPLLKKFDIRNDFDIPYGNYRNYAAVILLFHDPIRQLYPEIYKDSLKVFKETRERGIPFINDPIALSRTSKSIQGSIWTMNTIPCAKTYAFKDLNDLLSQNPIFPLFLRYDCGHDSTGSFFSRPIVDIDDLVKTFDDFRKKIIRRLHFDKPVAIQWIDTKDKNAIYRKYRTYIFGENVINGNVSASYSWYIHTHDRINEGWALKENQDFMFSKSDYPELMRKATTCLGLSINSIDYSIGQNGQLILWESNPHPAWGRWIQENHEYQKCFMKSLKDFFKSYLELKS